MYESLGDPVIDERPPGSRYRAQARPDWPWRGLLVEAVLIDGPHAGRWAALGLTPSYGPPAQCRVPVGDGQVAVYRLHSQGSPEGDGVIVAAEYVYDRIAY